MPGPGEHTVPAEKRTTEKNNGKKNGRRSERAAGFFQIRRGEAADVRESGI